MKAQVAKARDEPGQIPFVLTSLPFMRLYWQAFEPTIWPLMIRIPSWRRRLNAPALIAAGLAGLALGGEVSAPETARAFLKGPYLQAPGADTMTIMWESPTNDPGIVHYGLRGRLSQVYA